MNLKEELKIENLLDLYQIIEGMTDRTRIAMVFAAVSLLDTEGSIQKIRDEINSSRYDD